MRWFRGLTYLLPASALRNQPSFGVLAGQRVLTVSPIAAIAFTAIGMLAVKLEEELN